MVLAENKDLKKFENVILDIEVDLSIILMTFIAILM